MIQTILECAFGLIIILAAFNEEKLVILEDKLIKKIDVTSAEDVITLEKPKETFFEKILKIFFKIMIYV